MRNVRKVVFWCHLITGVSAGIIILLMSVTGVLLTFEKQIIAWADTRNYRSSPPPEASRLSPEALLERLKTSTPDATPQTLTLRSDPAMPASAGVAGGRTLYLNPYSGDVLGEGAPGVRRFFRTVTDWHRWLGTGGENRAVGRAITGACNLGFLFLVVSGLYIWWPRNWSWSSVRSVIWFKRGLAGKPRDFNWHNTIGFWSLVPLFVIVLSGVVISYTWAGNLVYRIAGEAPPAQRPAQPPSPRSESGTVSTTGLDQLFQRAQQQVEGWRTLSVRLVASNEAPLTFTIDAGEGGQPQKRSQLTLDRKTGDVSKFEPFSSFSSGRKLRSILRFAHTGEIAGRAGQAIAGLVSLGGAFLVWTGLALAWRRLKAWQARRRTLYGLQAESSQQAEA